MAKYPPSFYHSPVTTIFPALLYKSAYYRVGEITRNQDFARNEMIGDPEVFFEYFEEAFTSENWIVRLYKLKQPQNRVAWRTPVKSKKG